MAIKPRDVEKINNCTDNILNNYVDNDSIQFLSKMGGGFSANTNRTTNSYESFYAKLNASFHSGHANIFTVRYIHIIAMKTNETL